jgi:hypothetical protein
MEDAQKPKGLIMKLHSWNYCWQRLSQNLADRCANLTITEPQMEDDLNALEGMSTDKINERYQEIFGD